MINVQDLLRTRPTALKLQGRAAVSLRYNHYVVIYFIQEMNCWDNPSTLYCYVILYDASVDYAAWFVMVANCVEQVVDFAETDESCLCDVLSGQLPQSGQLQ